MSIPHQFATDVFLVVTVLACWLGVLGMWRMRKPIQALHYLSFPAAIASIAVTIRGWVGDRIHSSHGEMYRDLRDSDRDQLDCCARYSACVSRPGIESLGTPTRG